MYYYSPEVKLLLIKYSTKKVNVLNDFNPQHFQLPQIGPRPPYYTNPKYQQYYPII